MTSSDLAMWVVLGLIVASMVVGVIYCIIRPIEYDDYHNDP